MRLLDRLACAKRVAVGGCARQWFHELLLQFCLHCCTHSAFEHETQNKKPYQTLKLMAGSLSHLMKPMEGLDSWDMNTTVVVPSFRRSGPFALGEPQEKSSFSGMAIRSPVNFSEGWPVVMVDLSQTAPSPNPGHPNGYRPIRGIRGQLHTNRNREAWPPEIFYTQYTVCTK